MHPIGFVYPLSLCISLEHLLGLFISLHASTLHEIYRGIDGPPERETPAVDTEESSLAKFDEKLSSVEAPM